MDINDETNAFHQTPIELCKSLIKYIPTEEGDICYEPFAGINNFYNQFPINTNNIRTEIREGMDYKDYMKADWIITNPPFRLEKEGKRINSYIYLLEHFMTFTTKGICFLGNDRCFASITPKRMTAYNKLGWYIQKIVICNVKKWRGRYFFIIFQKIENKFIDTILGSF